MIAADIQAFIENSTVMAGSVSLTADDTSRIMAFAGSGSVAAALAASGWRCPSGFRWPTT